MARELMSTEMVLLDVDASSKEEVINILADAMERDERLNDKSGYVSDVLKREAGSSTAVGYKIATPHAKSVYVSEPSLAFLKLKTPIQWDDEEVVKMVFQIGVPSPGQGEKHLEILAELFRKLVHEEFREELSGAKTPEEVIKLIGMRN